MKQRYVYRVTSDNHTKELMTETAYKELTLEMRSGDFGSHTAVRIKLDSVKASQPILHYFRDYANDLEVAWDLVTKADVKRWVDYPEYDLYTENVIAVDFKKRVKKSA